MKKVVWNQGKVRVVENNFWYTVQVYAAGKYRDQCKLRGKAAAISVAQSYTEN